MILKLILAILFLMPVVASASEMENTCWTSIGNNEFNVTLTNGNFSGSKAGSIAKFNYSGVPLYYDVACWLDYEVGWGGSLISPFFYDQSKMNLPPSEFGNGFYKLSEDIDVKVYVGEGAMFPHQVPSEKGILGGNHPGVAPGIYLFSSYFGGSAKSTITLRLRRDQLGGIVKIPAGVKLFRAFRSVWSTTVFNDTPIMSMSTAGQFIQVPIVCTINNSAAIEVDFGDLDNTQISSDGSRYVKIIPLQYRCNTAVTQDIDINLIAAPSAFSSDFIATTLAEDVGVMVRYNGQVVKPNQKFSTTLLNGIGQDELQVAPVVKDVTQAVTGSFTASATLIMTVQ